jgi:hypothetical protein
LTFDDDPQATSETRLAMRWKLCGATEVSRSQQEIFDELTTLEVIAEERLIEEMQKLSKRFR